MLFGLWVSVQQWQKKHLVGFSVLWSDTPKKLFPLLLLHPDSTASQGKTSISQRMRLWVHQRDKLGTLAEARQDQILCFPAHPRQSQLCPCWSVMVLPFQVPLWFYPGLPRLSPSRLRVPRPPAAKPLPLEMMTSVWMSPSPLRRQDHSDAVHIRHFLAHLSYYQLQCRDIRNTPFWRISIDIYMEEHVCVSVDSPQPTQVCAF